MNSDFLKLYLVADTDHCPGDLVSAVAAAIAGGVTCVQLRAKSLADREHLALANRLREACARHEVPFLVNDRLDIALASRADGIHVGVDDIPIAAIRSLAGSNVIVGFSPDNDQQIIDATDAGADYLGIGPVYGTKTKDDAGNALGIAEFRRRCGISPVPVVGIGGISAANSRSVIEAGASGVAVVSAILAMSDPEKAARSIRRQSGS